MKIHRFRMFDRNIVIDVNSGAIHVVDDVVMEVLGYFETKTKEEIVELLSDKHSRESIQEAFEEIEYLINENMLFTEDFYKDIVMNDNNPTFIKAMCLNIAHDCNLKCKYCFASEGSYEGRRLLMSAEVGKKAIDFVIKNSGYRHNIEVDLFGGEPLMNFNAVKEIVEYAREQEKKYGKNIRFTMTTNATLLSDEIMDFIDKNMGNVILSIDGRKDVNDKIRIRYDGSGTFESILPKIKKMVARRDKNKQYYVRGTFTRENTDFYNDVVFLADEGFNEISIEPVVLPDESNLSLRKEDLPEIFEQYEKIALEIVKRKQEGKEFKFYHFNIDINGGPCVYKRVSGCGAGYEYVAVTPEGDIYPCHQFVGKEEFKLGNIEDGKLNDKLMDEFKNAHIYNKPICSECWAKFYCSGGCQANNHAFNRDIHIPYEVGCEMMKKRIECAIAVKVLDAEKN
ncbi:Anaerobic sulfatase-maturating enzyme [Caloramator mitchellensis]|uniref:Anaerobic sulfatase-maturating enzyme n=1 Tax=Caloramator mitchellensis TaxID=908809 RepID=A0A0R3K1W4_CALMK|nr:thioether cross-link-forming SCIFF peptide maturase [Caloramator mitchellensis]KRQ87518.1 Anaerobic sulfatase-maturating enzyme [Caloramator mitchellensis]